MKFVAKKLSKHAGKQHNHFYFFSNYSTIGNHHLFYGVQINAGKKIERRCIGKFLCTRKKSKRLAIRDFRIKTESAFV